MAVISVTRRQQWESHRSPALTSEFLQSWDYGDFLIRAGRRVLRLGVEEGGQLVYQVQAVIHSLPFGKTYAYLPRIILDPRYTPAVYEELKKQGILFARVESITDVPVSGFSTASTRNRQDQHTWILDVTPREEELLAAMHTKTRYNIRLAEKKGVSIGDEKDVDLYWKLRQITTERNQFLSHSLEYYKNLYSLNDLYQLNAYLGDTPLATVIQLKAGDRLVYLYGASSNEHRNLMAPYLLQWESIKLAKKLGCTEYDFWGTAAPEHEDEQNPEIECFYGYCWNKGHRLAGVARFKAGFGGFVRSYPGAFDVIFSPLGYKMYQGMRRFVRAI